MKKKNFILIVLILVIALISGLMLYQNKNFNSNQKNEEETNKVTELDISDLFFVNELMDLTPHYYNHDNDYNIYQDKKITVSDLSPEDFLAVAARYLMNSKKYYRNILDDNYSIDLYDESYDYVNGNDYLCFDEYGACEIIIDSELLRKTVKRIFNSEQYFEKISEFSGDGLLSCNLQNDKYACTNSHGGFYIGNPRNASKIFKAEQDDKNIYIYEKNVFLRTELDEASGKYIFKIYSNENSKNSINEEVYDYEDENGDIIDDIYEKYESIEKSAVIYKHTFTKSQYGSYYWVSTEPVNNID